MIKYFTEDIKFAYKGKAANNRWLRFVAGAEMKKIGDVNIIFCSDNYLLDINMKYLQHDYFTDIITFDYCEGDTLSGDLFISIDRVGDNAKTFNVSRETELLRVMIHGVMHLVGYDDQTDEQEAEIHRMEDFYIDVYNKKFRK